ncbi:hypothetical protein AVEN_81312-1 [Araneus ventricosus]|uniref:Uncharacterized protein n=1 Tax=Araneus ventricosus TaxID=182803 RepID=A0A4Y2B5S8_ARAVE|nr:hypothetical protein AVEN_81312-1 [Araneus ventricosus]
MSSNCSLDACCTTTFHEISTHHRPLRLNAPNDSTTDNSNPETKSVQELLSTKLNSTNEKIKIKFYIKIRNKGLALDCENEEEIQKLIEKIQKSDELKEQIVHKKPKERRPGCIIYNIPKGTAEQENRNILVKWIKADDGYRDNEEADTLAKKAITEVVVMKALNTRCELKQHLQELYLKKWQNLWENGNTGRSVHKVLKTVHLKPVFWTSEEILFATRHGPFPSFLNRFHLSDSESCICREIGDPIHYVTSCPLTLSWLIRKPSTSL